jgi:hypothetical protein
MEKDPAKRAEWRPIEDYHEEYGLVVVIDIYDPGGVSLSWDEDIPGTWTHFAELPLLTNEMAEELIDKYEERAKSKWTDPLKA